MSTNRQAGESLPGSVLVPRGHPILHLSRLTRDRTSMTPEEMTALRSQKYNATVIRLLRIHSDLLVMRVKPDFPRPPHKPGQYGVLGLGYWEPRMPGCQEETLAAADEKKL